MDMPTTKAHSRVEGDEWVVTATTRDRSGEVLATREIRVPSGAVDINARGNEAKDLQGYLELAAQSVARFQATAR